MGKVIAQIGPALVGRRGFLTAGAGVAVGGCMHCKFPELTATELARAGDCHAHFFNAADLPIAGFVKYVLIPRYLPNAPDILDALVDIIAYVGKTLTLTATEELDQIGSGGMTGRGDVAVGEFGRVAAMAHRSGLKGVSLVNAINDREERSRAILASPGSLAASHATLAGILGIARGRDQAVFEAIAKEGPQPAAVRTATDSDLQCPENTGSITAEQRAFDVRTLLYWAYLMCRARCAHVDVYLKKISHSKLTAVSVATNLLVDYDKWLDDKPSDGSEQAAQVTYWTRYSKVSATMPQRIKLHTFAGYDPLRQAEEIVLEKRTATTFDTLAQWARDGRNPASTAPQKVVGFKIYPPMGFRPDSNKAIKIPESRGGKAILKRWEKYDQPAIGAAIDTALDGFFKFCVEEDVPVITHARESNIALADHGDDPAPYHWLCRAEAAFKEHGKPLRLCVGHFDLENCLKSPKPDSDVLRDALAMNQQGKARIYFDFSFDSRILEGTGAAFMLELATICDDAKDNGEYLMFGTDWIMLGNQPNAGEYLQRAYDAANSVAFWREEGRLGNLFGGNLTKFLNLKTR